MTAADTRAFMAAMAIAQHHGRPRTPTDQAHVESFFSHLKGEWPHLAGLDDPGALDRDLARVRRDYNTIRLHAAIGYVTPDDEHAGRGPAIRRARPRDPSSACCRHGPSTRPAHPRESEIAPMTALLHRPSTRPHSLLECWVERSGRSIKGSETPHFAARNTKPQAGGATTPPTLRVVVERAGAGVEANARLINQTPPEHLWTLAAAGAIGYLGNLVAARVRTRAGERLNSPALIADGHHARADAHVRLAVIA
jgi:hypothetical protein